MYHFYQKRNCYFSYHGAPHWKLAFRTPLNMILTVPFVSVFRSVHTQSRQWNFQCYVNNVVWLLKIHSAYITCINIQIFTWTSQQAHSDYDLHNHLNWPRRSPRVCPGDTKDELRPLWLCIYKSSLPFSFLSVVKALQLKVTLGSRSRGEGVWHNLKKP